MIRASATEIAPRGEAAFRWLDTEVRAFYARRGGDAFKQAKQLGGMSLVLGGSSRVPSKPAQLSVNSSAIQRHSAHPRSCYAVAREGQDGGEISPCPSIAGDSRSAAAEAARGR